MSATNHTTNYELPIFVGTDKPAWLVDWNSAMTAIDTALHQVEGKADQAGTDIGGIESSITTINSTLTSINNAVSQLRIDTNANTGSINTITSLIGNGEPTTTDKTIIGAINEINGEVYDFNLSTHDTFSVTNPVAAVSSNSQIDLLVNTDGTAGKIYGGLYIYDASTGISLTENDTVLAKLSSSNLPAISQSYDIFIGYAVGSQTNNAPVFVKIVLRFNTDKTISVVGTVSGTNTVNYLPISLPPCLYFLSDLGD